MTKSPFKNALESKIAATHEREDAFVVQQLKPYLYKVRVLRTGATVDAANLTDITFSKGASVSIMKDQKAVRGDYAIIGRGNITTRNAAAPDHIDDVARGLLVSSFDHVVICRDEPKDLVIRGFGLTTETPVLSDGAGVTFSSAPTVDVLGRTMTLHLLADDDAIPGIFSVIFEDAEVTLDAAIEVRDCVWVPPPLPDTEPALWLGAANDRVFRLDPDTLATLETIVGSAGSARELIPLSDNESKVFGTIVGSGFFVIDKVTNSIDEVTTLGEKQPAVYANGKLWSADPMVAGDPNGLRSFNIDGSGDTLHFSSTYTFVPPFAGLGSAWYDGTHIWWGAYTYSGTTIDQRWLIRIHPVTLAITATEIPLTQTFTGIHGDATRVIVSMTNLTIATVQKSDLSVSSYTVAHAGFSYHPRAVVVRGGPFSFFVVSGPAIDPTPRMALLAYEIEDATGAIQNLAALGFDTTGHFHVHGDTMHYVADRNSTTIYPVAVDVDTLDMTPGTPVVVQAHSGIGVRNRGLLYTE